MEGEYVWKARKKSKINQLNIKKSIIARWKMNNDNFWDGSFIKWQLKMKFKHFPNSADLYIKYKTFFSRMGW